MQFWAGVTDNRWFRFLEAQRAEEVNFWQPSGRAPFSRLPAGTPFLFKLKSPQHHIAGGGYFVRFTRLPIRYAWDVFGAQNGVSSLAELTARIRDLGNVKDAAHHQIGCNVLTHVFFLPRDLWIDVRELFPSNIVCGKIYDTVQQDGAALWAAVDMARKSLGVADAMDSGSPERFGKSFLTRARLGQGAFRALVTDAYQRRCAITGESTLPVLEAAHIQPYAEHGLHAVQNGLLLRSDFHKLFDSGLVTIEPDLTIRVSGRIRDAWFNGKAYYRLHGQPLAVVPDDEFDRPAPDFLKWHNESCFVE